MMVQADCGGKDGVVYEFRGLEMIEGQILVGLISYQEGKGLALT